MLLASTTRLARRALLQPLVRTYASTGSNSGASSTPADDDAPPPVDVAKIPKSWLADGSPEYFGAVRQDTIPRDVGDYPELKLINAKDKDPYVKYWDQQNRRNQNDVLGEQDDILSMMGPEMSPYPPGKATRELSVFFVLMGAVGYAVYLSDPASQNPAAPRTFPFNGLVEELGGNPKHAARTEAVHDL
ncbi:hypothetical protein RI367_002246 [Sorochytrium milnesiophthora]